jgi:hypothetical protein
MNRGTHWGALLFTLFIAGAAVLFLSGPLLAPLTTPVSSPRPSTERPVSLRTPLPAELHSEWVTQSAAPVIDVGGTASVTIQFRNIGTVPWVKSSPSEIRLGEVGTRPLPAGMKTEWFSPDRPAVQEESVVPARELVSFTFKITGTAPGTYRLQVRPVVDGVAWLEDQGVQVDITVRG